MQRGSPTTVPHLERLGDVGWVPTWCRLAFFGTATKGRLHRRGSIYHGACRHGAPGNGDDTKSHARHRGCVEFERRTVQVVSRVFVTCLRRWGVWRVDEVFAVVVAIFFFFFIIFVVVVDDFTHSFHHLLELFDSLCVCRLSQSLYERVPASEQRGDCAS